MNEKPPIDFDKATRALKAGKSLNAAVSPTIKTKTHADLRGQAPVSWLVKKILPSQGLASIYGPSGSGKSFLAMDICAAIALGRPWFGHKVKQANVLYCALEGAGGLANRCNAWAEHNDMESLPDSFKFCDSALDLIYDVDAIADAAEGCGVVVIDTLNQSTPGTDENSSRDMGNVIKAAKELQERLRCVVVLVHHTGKDATRGMRGHSSLFAAMDSVIEVSNTVEAGRGWCVSKSKEDATSDVTPFVLDIVKLGVDEDGDAVTSCVISDLRTVTQFTQKPSGKNAARFHATILTHIAQYGELGRGLSPAGKRSIKYDDAVEICMPFLPPDRSQKSNTTKILNKMINEGLFGQHDGWIW